MGNAEISVEGRFRVVGVDGRWRSTVVCEIRVLGGACE
jgi:hypothetical protein